MLLFLFRCMIFQEYTEEFRDISKGKSKEGIPAGPITLINQRPVGEDLHVRTLVFNILTSFIADGINVFAFLNFKIYSFL